MVKKYTGERLMTSIYTRDSIEHLHRYAIVKDYVKDKIVLDIACGEGYGANLISRTAKFVYGVDIDDIIIQEAKMKYREENLEFLTGSAIKIPLNDNSIDVIVSFETIEHPDKHLEMIDEIKRVLKSNGMLIISSPDKFFYSDERNFNNQFHVKELYKQEFVDLISKSFSKIQLLTQKYTNGNSLIEDDTINNKVHFFSGNYTEITEIIINPLYLIAIASDDTFANQKSSIFDGSHSVDTDFKYKINKIYSSNSYKLGHLILLPIKFLKRIFN
jgi:ubiquinone/menaquinone biosynthesis C-methylase UbiE